MRIAVTGRHGQVAMALAEKAAATGDEIVYLARPDFDLADSLGIAPAIAAARADLIVSAAAHTAVDRAESEPELARAVNGVAPGLIGAAAARLGLPVIHLSTDYVFAGTGTGPHDEADPTGPLSVYGETKLAGERALAAATPNHAILRTAWVYSPFGGNFVRTMLRLAGDRDEVRVVADQRGNPTSALDIAAAVIEIGRRLVRQPDDATLRGVFHLVGSGSASWAELAEAVFAVSAGLGGPSATVIPIGTADYPTKARRPANAELSTRRLRATYGFDLPDWHASLPETVRRLLEA